MTEEKPPAAASFMGPSAMVLLHALAWVPLMLCLLGFVPRLKVLFADQAVPISQTAEVVVAWSDVLVAAGPLWLVGMIILLAIDWAVLRYLRLSNRTALVWLWFVLLTLAPLGAGLVAWLAIWSSADQALMRMAG